MSVAELIEITCPRCSQPAEVEFFGPCDPCRDDLRMMGGDVHDVEVEAYAPKMNVTPNFLATKDN